MEPENRAARDRREPPHNNGFEQSARGRHAVCLRWVHALGSKRKRRAGALRPAMAGLRPCSLLKPVLYGLVKQSVLMK